MLKHRHIQASSSIDQAASQSLVPLAMASANTKPIPAPRRKPDNSVRAQSSTNNNRELDDEIVEIRFDDDSGSTAIDPHSQRKHSAKNVRSSGAVAGLGIRRTSSLKSSGRSASTEVDVRTANIKRSMDELRRKEENENEITKGLERQLADIRRLEERQREILQSTLRQVVHSVNDSQGNSTTANPQADEIQMDSEIDCSSLLSPSFNRKIPLHSPLMSHRTTASPQSPRKLSSAGRRTDMQTISENGGYSLTEVAAMSPASSHRTLSSMASPSLQPRSEYGSLSSHAISSRQSRGSLGLADPLVDKNFRLSASYTELIPQLADNIDRSGYFSDRETDRRRGGDELKNYTDEARRSLLQFEIEKRRKQVEENNMLRSELRRLIESGTIPAAKYDRLRDMYRDHINRSREYLGFSSSSLSSISTGGRSSRLGYDGFTTDSDCTSSTEHLCTSISQSSTVERLKQSNDNTYRQAAAAKSAYSTPVSCNQSLRTPTDSIVSHGSGLSPSTATVSQSSPTQRGDRNMPAMPLLDIRAPKLSPSRPDSACELVKIGEWLRYYVYKQGILWDD